MGVVVEYVAYCLSVITIISCFVLKVPQIINIYERKSAVGININALLMEVVSFTVTALYNYTNDYSIITYMEYPIILIQQMILIFLVLKYNQELNNENVRFAIIVYGVLVAAFATKTLPPSILGFLVPFSTPVSGGSKCAYIYGMVQAESSEATSLITWVISIATNLFRIFTVYVDSADTKLLFNFTVSALLSSAVLATALHYRAQPPAPGRNPNQPRIPRHPDHRD